MYKYCRGYCRCTVAATVTPGCYTIPHIQDIEIISAFHDGVSDLKTVEEIAMRKSKKVDDQLTVVDVCIEVSEARA
jgi:hypothetical protein